MTDISAPSNGGKIGGVKKEYVYAGGALLVVVLGVVVYTRSKKQAASSSTMVTDPGGNVCVALNPSGYCPGSPQDLAYSGTGVTASGQNSASWVGGQIIGYDGTGNPIYSGNQPSGFRSNAEWSQAALSML